MPREPELYRDTLERLRYIAERQCGLKLLYTYEEAAQMIGYKTQTLKNNRTRYGFKGGRVTLERLAKALT